jgi:very-short-patch-repair endonuclease
MVHTKISYILLLRKEYSSSNPLPIEEVTPGSNTSFRWVCNFCSFEWSSRISHRLSGSSNCPACSKKILTTANPELAAEWGSQNDTTPDDHKPGSRVRVWWLCAADEHPEYLAAIANRRLSNVGCPLCKTPSFEKSLAAIAPHLVSQWSSKNSLHPEQVYAKATTPITWECNVCQHEWSTRVSYRVNNDKGCPSCENRTLVGKTVAEVLPHLIAQWSEQNVDSPEVLSAGSKKKVLWTCDKSGHPDYEMRPILRRMGYGCNRCVLAEKSLAAIKPDIARQWHPTKNGEVRPNDVMSASGMKAWWMCEANHEWESQIYSRTSSNQTGCPICSQSSISSIEEELRRDFTSDSIIQDVRQEHNSTLPIPIRKRKQIKVDILGQYKEQPIVVEYDGWYWHSGQRKSDAETPRERDTEKTQALLAAGYLVVRIREVRKNATLDLLDLSHQNLLQVQWTYSKDSSELRQAIYSWLEKLNP